MGQVMNKMKVLAVDDNRTNLHILQVFLKKLGHDVILAENGQEAVRRFENDAPDLILLDIMMPVMDGFEAARLIKAAPREKWTPIIFLSALNRDENLVEGLDAGADDYLTKPINFVVLEAKLRSVQRSLGMQQESIDSLRRVQAISDNVLDAILTIDENKLIASVNRSTERMFAYGASEMLGQPVGLLLPTLARGEPDEPADNGLIHFIGREQEGEGRRKNGQSFPLTLGVTEVTLDKRRMFIGVIRDTSAQKQAEQKLHENAAQLQAYYDQTQNEQQLAMRLMEKQLHRRGLVDPHLQYKVIAAESFSGDIVAASRSPEGNFYALLADATGHGLTAAISALPVLAIFYRLARRNHTVREIILELNQQLKESMPVGRFVAATLVCLNEQSHSGEIWVGGTPEAILIDRWGRSEQAFVPANLPLGIVDNDEMECQPVEFTWTKESQIVLCSDGLIEANNRYHVQFGLSGLLAAAANTAPTTRFQQIEQALAKHLEGTVAADDISLMVIDCP
jgi:two-component system, HptB-dependent secretion and biofilm response regulator